MQTICHRYVTEKYNDTAPSHAHYFKFQMSKKCKYMFKAPPYFILDYATAIVI